MAQFIVHVWYSGDAGISGAQAALGCGVLVVVVVGAIVLSTTEKAVRTSSEPPWDMSVVTGWAVIAFLLVNTLATVIYAFAITSGELVGFVVFAYGAPSSGIGLVILVVLALLLHLFNRHRTEP
ncbi:hypothetical protein [Nesterenkonia suensis]